MLKLKLDEPKRDFDNLAIFSSLDLGFESKKICLAIVIIIFPWIRIRGSAYFYGSVSRKPKSCGSNGSESGSLALFMCLTFTWIYMYTVHCTLHAVHVTLDAGPCTWFCYINCKLNRVKDLQLYLSRRQINIKACVGKYHIYYLKF